MTDRDIIIAELDIVRAQRDALLAACKQLEARISMLRAADQGGRDTAPVPLFLSSARAAIAKAEGND